MCAFAFPLYVGCSDVSIHLFLASYCISILNSSDIDLKPNPYREVNTYCPVIKSSQSILHRELMAVCFEIHTKHK